MKMHKIYEQIRKHTVVEQYTVEADVRTGEWLDEPMYVTDVTLADWSKMVDTEAAHFDTYEVPSEDSVNIITRAIEVVWVTE